MPTDSQSAASLKAKPKLFFLQTPEYSQFWQTVNSAPFKVFEHSVDFGGFQIKAYVYQYPYYLGSKFWYLSKGPNLYSQTKIDLAKLQKAWGVWLKQLQDKAKKNGVLFIKLELNDLFCESLKLDSKNFTAIKNNLEETIKTKFYNGKRINYTQSTYLDLTSYNSLFEQELNKLKIPQNLDNIQQISCLDLNTLKTLYQNFNTQVRRYTKKSKQLLESGYTIDTQKSNSNIEQIYSVLSQTAARQNFNLQPLQKIQALIQAEFSQIILVKNPDNQAISVFVGVYLDGILTYLYGGNNSEALQIRSQYLLQQTALLTALILGAKEYDFGGYTKGSGYSQFKDGYKGIHRHYPGPFDLACSWEYSFFRMLGK